jgi:hypothetical protein
MLPRPLMENNWKRLVFPFSRVESHAVNHDSLPIITKVLLKFSITHCDWINIETKNKY